MKILIIQTAFIGDVVLATPLIEKLHAVFPHAQLDFLLRKGNENLLLNHPGLHQVIIFDKSKNKYSRLWKLARKIRQEKYDVVINVQRFFASGFLTVMSGAKQKIGFDKNPWSWLFTKKVTHVISATAQGDHEVKRNLQLIEDLTGNDHWFGPRLYPSDDDYQRMARTQPYICIAPTSVWFTKQYPVERWIDFINLIPHHLQVMLLGGPGDKDICHQIAATVTHPETLNMAGTLSFLGSAALMKKAVMNYVNDSAPLHFASAVNAPVTAVFCSTVPQFGFGPLSDDAHIVEYGQPLSCRPCGLHGKRACPQGHFNCSHIEAIQLLSTLPTQHRR